MVALGRLDRVVKLHRADVAEVDTRIALGDHPVLLYGDVVGGHAGRAKQDKANDSSCGARKARPKAGERERRHGDADNRPVPSALIEAKRTRREAAERFERMRAASNAPEPSSAIRGQTGPEARGQGQLAQVYPRTRAKIRVTRPRQCSMLNATSAPMMATATTSNTRPSLRSSTGAI